MIQENKKILHIIDSGGLYGAEVMLLNLIEEQIVLGLKPIIASIGDNKTAEKPFETEAIKRGFNLIKFRMTPGPNIYGACTLLKFAKKNNIDLLHSHGYKGNILLGFIPHFIRKIPIITTLHGYTSTRGLSKMRVYEWLDSMSHKFINSVVLVNKGMLSHPKLKNRNNIKFKIINNGIPITNSNNQINSNNSTNPINTSIVTPQIEKFCKNHFVIGSIGRLSTEKGFIYLIEALNQLKKKGVSARLIIIGEGSEREKLEKIIIKSGIKDNVLFTGYVKNANRFIPFFNVYAISSLTEGLPITLLEAMQAKVPIVATKVGGIPEVIKNNYDAILVNPCCPEQLVNAFYKIYNDNNFALKLTINAYKNLTRNYSSNNMASKYNKLYLTVSNQEN